MCRIVYVSVYRYEYDIGIVSRLDYYFHIRDIADSGIGSSSSPNQSAVIVRITDNL